MSEVIKSLEGVTRQELIDYLSACPGDRCRDDLEETVHDLFMEIAEEVIQEGIACQVDFIIARGHTVDSLLEHLML